MRSDRPVIEALAAGVSDELRTALMGLQDQVRVLEAELEPLIAPSAYTLSILAGIASELERLDGIVVELARRARPLRLGVQSVPTRELVSPVAAFANAVCANAGVELGLSLESAPDRVLGDVTLLRHALLGLVLAIVRATPRGGRVTVVMRRDANEVAIEVTGSPKRVFKGVAGRASAGTRPLSDRDAAIVTAYRIVEEHGGTLRLDVAQDVEPAARIVLPAAPTHSR